MRPLISVIVLAYNAEKDIKKCIESIINQTYKNIEIIIINDGSIDNTEKIIKNINDNRIIYIERENKGTYYSRVEGYKRSTGEYITFVDSDDYLLDNYIEVLYSNLVKYNADIAHCFNLIEKNKKIITSHNNSNIVKSLNKDEFLNKFYSSIEFNPMWKQLYKKDLLYDMDKINKKIMYGEDLLCNYYIYKNVSKVIIIDSELYVYQINNNGITLSKSKEKIYRKIEDILFVYLKIFNDIDKKYKEKITDKMYFYLTVNLYILTKYLTKKEFSDYVLNILNRIEEMKNYKQKQNKHNIIINHAYNLLIKGEINKLYYFDKYIYFIFKKLKK